jgi:phage-related protein
MIDQKREETVPKIEVIIFREDSGRVPLLEWLDTLPAKVQNRIIVRIERLAEYGHELRRPEADYLHDGIYELRVRHRRENYRVLYFFHEKRAVLSHGIVKESDVPRAEIDRAIGRCKRFTFDPESHTYRE